MALHLLWTWRFAVASLAALFAFGLGAFSTACNGPAAPGTEGGASRQGLGETLAMVGEGAGASGHPPSLTDDEALAIPLEALRAAYHDAAARAARNEATAAGVRAHLEAARLARTLGRRTRDAAMTAAARRHLREAARRPRLPGACEAARAQVVLEAIDAADPAAAYLAAHRVVVRFGEDEFGAECVASARRTLDVLRALRPPDSVLAAADALPDDDDALAVPGGVEPVRVADRARGVAASQVTAWATARGEVSPDGPAPVLQRIEVSARTSAAAVAAEADAHPRRARVVLHFDRVALFERGELPADGPLPRRAYLDFPRASSSDAVPSVQPVGAAGVARVRTATIAAPGTGAHGLVEPSLRVTFDLEEDTRMRLFFLPDPYRIVLDFDASLDVQGPPAAAPAGPRASEARPLRLVVLDPGHGGDDHGAPGDAIREKDAVLDIARRARAVLARRLPDTRVLLTRDRDIFVSLEQRVAMANVAGADAFVSIHLNASPTEAERGGVGTFVLDTRGDRAALALAARENGTSMRDVGDLARLLASLHRDEQARGSMALAEAVHRATLQAGRAQFPRLGDRGTRGAFFYVLLGAEMPAVLLEASFVMRAPEARLLAREEYRQALAEGIAEGLVRYARGDGG
jgi:N-acetylmuramoyl-L-alanine amidase